MPICFYQNFLVSLIILYESKSENDSKTIRVTRYLYKMLFPHKHHTLLIDIFNNYQGPGAWLNELGSWIT